MRVLSADVACLAQEETHRLENADPAEWDEVFHTHEEFCEPMAVALRPNLCAKGDKHLAWQLFRPEFVEYLAHQQAQEEAEAAASAMDTGGE